MIWAHVLALFGPGQEAWPPSLSLSLSVSPLLTKESVSLPGGFTGRLDTVTQGTWQGTQMQRIE